MAVNPMDTCVLVDQSIPQWKRELIIRRRSLGRTLQVGNSSVKLTCPAVVAIVRQPEIVGVTENVPSKQQSSSISEEPTSTSFLLNQNPVDFLPSISSALSVGNMRLDACNEINNLVINGIDVKNKQSDVVSSDVSKNYNLITGEDKTLHIKKRVNTKTQLDKNKCIPKTDRNDKVLSKGTNGFLNIDDDSFSDSSEELQYGPGIVNKLKTKYLSMTLREQKRNGRPSIIHLRRATSLENMLECDGNLNKTNKTVIESGVKADSVTVNNRTASTVKSLGLSPHCALSYLENRSVETIKRARSMDTLLKSESQTTLKTNFGTNGKHNILNEFSIHLSKPSSIVNENIIIVENPPAGLSNETYQKDNNTSEESTRHLNSGVLPDRERPPPDLVRQKLKIFETSKTNAKLPSKNSLSKQVTGFTNTTNHPTCSFSNRSNDRTKSGSSKPTLSPKPVLSPERIKQNKSRIGSPKKNQSNVISSSPVHSIDSPSKINKYFEKQLHFEKSEHSNNTKIPSYDKSIGVISPKVINPCSISPLVTTISNDGSSASSTKGKITSDNSSQNIGEKISFINHQDKFEEVDIITCSKPVPESALENIRQGGISMQFSFKNDNSLNSSEAKSYLPRPKSPLQALNTSLLQNKLEKATNIIQLRPQSSHTKQVGVIRPIVTTKPCPALTEQEIEKNLINRVKSIEQPISKVVDSITSLPDNMVGPVSSDNVLNKNFSLPHVCANSKNRTQGLWDDKIWRQNQNTIVFNFSDRKEVPDYIENDGLILKGRRDRRRPGEGGFLLQDSVGEESSTDGEELLFSEPPSPCHVIFEGGNILINGKSNLKKSPKEVKLRIKFNDEATTMFEYPSEASLVEEEELCAQSAVEGSDESSNKSTAAANSGLNVPIGGSLGAYTPRQMDAEDWQLGVTPVQIPSTVPASHSQLQDEDQLKPASPESTVIWSEETASDLLF